MQLTTTTTFISGNFSAPLLAASSTVTGTISVGIELPNYEILCYFPVVFINISIAVSTSRFNQPFSNVMSVLMCIVLLSNRSY